MIDPAKSLSPSQTRDELSALLDRARQERFRLLDLLKQSRAAVSDTADSVATVQAMKLESTTSAATPSKEALPGVQKLIRKVEQLNDAVTERMEKLHATESRVKTRTDQLERLEMKMTNLAERFEAMIAEARSVEPAIAEAEARTQELRTVAEGLQQHGHDLTKTVDARLAEHTAEFNRRLDDHHEALVSQQIKEQQSFADAVSRQKQNHLDQLQRELSEKRAELSEVMARQQREIAARYTAENADALMEAEEAGIAQVGQLRERLATMVDEVLGDTEQRGRATLDQLREQVVTAMGRADDVSRSLKQRLDRSLSEHQTKTAAAVARTDDDLLVRSQKLDERLAGLADLFDHQADQIMIDLKGRANRMLDQMAASIQGGEATHPAATAQTGPPMTGPASQSDAGDGPQLKVA